MSEYIDRDAAVKAAQDGADEWDGGFNRNRDMYIEAAMDNVPTVEPMRWIPVTERLPEKPYGCLVTVWDDNAYGEPFENILPYFVGYDGEQWNDYDGIECPFEIIAWMPLPEPYKGEE